LLVYIIHTWHSSVAQHPGWNNALTLATLVVLVATGHFGGAITHGENYIWEPLQPNKPIDLANSSLFTAAIAPILDSKCNKCHNERKAKGKLVMSTQAGLLKGGETGPLWQSEEVDSSLLLKRIHLPLEIEEHMPPEGKPQLTSIEKDLLAEWIRAGADMEKPLAKYEQTSTLFLLAEKHLGEKGSTAAKKSYDFPAASPKVIAALNTPFCSVEPLSVNSPALSARISVREYFKPSFIAELKQIKKQLVYLNLTDLPINNEHLKDLSDFPNLEKLILNGTEISGSNLETIGSLQALQSLALSNTRTDSSLVELLRQLVNLEEVYVWNTGIDSSLVVSWQAEFPNVQFHLGFVPDLTEKLKMSPPTVANEKMLLRPGELVRLKHTLPGAVIRYTLNGEEPDSTESTIYEEAMPIEGITTIRAKAFREGWEASETVSYTLFQAGIKPASVKLLKAISGNYRGSGEATLVDAEKGNASNFRSPFWLGFQDNPMDVLFTFEEPKKINEIVLSYAVNMGSYIMPPKRVEIWGGNDPNALQKLHTSNPEQPTGYGPNTVEAVNVEFEPMSYTHYKVVAFPVTSLPRWHGGAGDKGWVFSDEVLFFATDD
ncbi:MAG: chitobiase/beta-hexosaminidase C-terminal domain-containing protein, partial [Saprospiraceae bacterium]|nr:chitobiase/beta-hexosaminidase C-terminal domain-containing protein [Saprospiraceae bacterium]